MKLLLAIIALSALSVPTAFAHITALPPNTDDVFKTPEQLQIYVDVLYNQESDLYLPRENPQITNSDGVSRWSLNGNAVGYAIFKADVHYHGISKNGMGGTEFDPQVLPPFKIIGLYGTEDRPIVVRPYSDPNDPAELPEDLDDASPSKPHHDENDPNPKPDKPSNEKSKWQKWLDWLIKGTKANLSGDMLDFYTALGTTDIVWENPVNRPGTDPVRTEIFMNFVKEYLVNQNVKWIEEPTDPKIMEEFLKQNAQYQTNAEKLLDLFDTMERQLDNFQELLDKAKEDPDFLTIEMLEKIKTDTSPQQGGFTNSPDISPSKEQHNPSHQSLPDNIPSPTLQTPIPQKPTPLPQIEINYNTERKIPQCCDPIPPKCEICPTGPLFPEKEPNTGQTPSPLSFNLNPYDIIINEQRWPDQCLYWMDNGLHESLWWLKAYNDSYVCMNIKKSGGYSLVIDYDNDGILESCDELLCNFYNDEYRNVYQILSDTTYDTNQDGWFGEGDFKWKYARAWHHDTGELIPMEWLGIRGFELTGYIDLDDDYTNYDSWKDPKLNGLGQYSDCNYEEDWAYQRAVSEGWTCTPISMGHERVTAYNPLGVLLENGMYIQTRDYVVGYWTPEQVERSGY